MSDSFEIEHVAIIGMSGRFPGASNINEFWDNLCNGVESISNFSKEELLENGADPETIKAPDFIGARGVLSNVEMFDDKFFGMNAREATLTDPQHRLFLECTWEAIENGGYTPKAIEGSVGVFAGSSLNTYLLHHVFSNPNVAKDFVQGFQAEGYPMLLGNDKDYLATRVAHKLDFRGPAISIQTACSTSLVAVVQACQSLLTYQCDAAIAGGVSITFPQQRGYIYQEGALASKDGHCRAFDASATGTVFGSGCGIVFLKRLSEALRDNDNIYSVIKGAAINNDGSDKVSFSAPSINGQAEVISLTHALAEISADTIDYIEAHGTGTPLGDPIEVAALTQAFRETTDKKRFCGLGSVKSNVGHLEVAAGVTGLIKASLAVYNRRIPPSLHFEQPNPNIDFDESPFYMVAEMMDWPEKPHPRRAGVSSFGMGGTNAHIIIEEAPMEVNRTKNSTPHILPVSAQTKESLESACVTLGRFLNEDPSLNFALKKGDLQDISYTLQMGRQHFSYRKAVIAKDLTEASDALTALSTIKQVTQIPKNERPSIVFLFPGQGSQSVNMCKDLYQGQSFFRKTVDDCCDKLFSSLGFDLREILYPSEGEEEKAEEQLQTTAVAQPALFVIGYSMAKLLNFWGIQPQALSGHSIGEFVAAVLAEVMSLEDGLRLVASRGRLMQQMPEGAMLVTKLSEAEVQPFLTEGLSISAMNAPKNTVISGNFDNIERLKHSFTSQGVNFRELKTSHAFHCEMMSVASQEFKKEVSNISLGKATLKIVSTKTGQWIDPSDWLEPVYWSQQMLEPVRFMEAGMTLLKETSMIFIDIGPGFTLANLIRQNPARKPDNFVVACTPLNDKDGDYIALLHSIGKLWSAGVELDWDAIRGGEICSKLPLPTYPFDRNRLWIDNKKATTKQSSGVSLNTQLPLMEEKNSMTNESLEELFFKQLQIMVGQLESIKRNQEKN